MHVSTYFVANHLPTNTPVPEEVQYPTLQLAGAFLFQIFHHLPSLPIISALHIACGCEVLAGLWCGLVWLGGGCVRMLAATLSNGQILGLAANQLAALAALFSRHCQVVRCCPHTLLTKPPCLCVCILSCTHVYVLSLHAGDPRHLSHDQLTSVLLGATRDTAAAEVSHIMSRLGFISTYAFSKLLTEQLVDDPATLPGVCKSIVRPSLISSIAGAPYPG